MEYEIGQRVKCNGNPDGTIVRRTPGGYEVRLMDGCRHIGVVDVAEAESRIAHNHQPKRTTTRSFPFAPDAANRTRWPWRMARSMGRANTTLHVGIGWPTTTSRPGPEGPGNRARRSGPTGSPEH